MHTPDAGRFQYTRAHGERRIYDVTLDVMRRNSGVCAYAAWVQFQAEYVGSGSMLPLPATTREARDA